MLTVVQPSWWTSTTLTELSMLLLAVLLSALIGVERQRRLKSAGIRTHALVGTGAAVFTLVSAFGFSASNGETVTYDPSRVAAQVVSGIGFLGAGVIFVRQDKVSGLTTAASIWLTASVGMACGSGQPLLAVVATIAHFMITLLLERVGQLVRRADVTKELAVTYNEGNGALRAALEMLHQQEIGAVLTRSEEITKPGKPGKVRAHIVLTPAAGRVLPESIVLSMKEVPGIIKVRTVTNSSD